MRVFKIAALGMIALFGNAYAGNEIGNGGDGYAQEFVALGREALERLRRNPDPRIANIDALAAAVDEAKVSTKDKLELAESEVDAINYPESRRIEVNRTRWKGYGADEKMALVLHEYLGIARIDDSSYQISGTYTRAANELVSIAESPISETLRFSLGLGSGIHAYGGNIGMLYSSSQSFEVRAGFSLSSDFILKAGSDLSNHKFAAQPNGFVDVRIWTVNFSLEYHPFMDKLRPAPRGFDPYITFGGDLVQRKQTLAEFSTTDTDMANGVGGGLGLNYFFTDRVALWIEAKANQIFFKDRYLPEYVPSGVVDTTGLLYSGMGGAQFYF